MKQSPRNTTSGSLGRQSYLLASDSSKPWSILRVYHKRFCGGGGEVKFFEKKAAVLALSKEL